MKTKSIGHELIQHLRKHKKFQFGGNLEKEMSSKLPTKPSTIARTLRSLAEEGKIDKSYEYVGNPLKRVVLYRGKSI